MTRARSLPSALLFAAGGFGLALLVAPYVVAEGVPQTDTLFYSGVLELDGVPVEGVRNVNVRLFDDGTTGTLRCETSAAGIVFEAGRFRVPLLDTCTDAVRAEPDLFIEVEIAGDTFPRVKIGAVPYAVEAERAQVGAVGIGSIIAHVTHLPGSESVEAMRARGFAVCDGSTPAEQGIADAVLAGATPDLNAAGRFLRGTDGPTGVLQADATARNGLALSETPHDHVTRVSDGPGSCNRTALFNTGSVSAGPRVEWTRTTASGCSYDTNGAVSNTTLETGDAETRPANMSVVWLMRVR